METIKKRISFATITNIIFAVTSLFYVTVSLVYFIAMTYTMLNGNEYEMLGFIFGLIGLPIALAAFAIPVVRIVILVCTLNLNKNLKNGGKTSGLLIATGVMQILDAIGSPLIYSFISTILYLMIEGPLQSVFGDGRLFNLIYGLLGLTIGLPVLIKGVLQIVSAVLLFKCKEPKKQN
jgi:hypothetical protein